MDCFEISANNCKFNSSNGRQFQYMLIKCSFEYSSLSRFARHLVEQPVVAVLLKKGVGNAKNVGYAHKNIR